MNWIIAIAILYTIWLVLNEIDPKAANAFAVLTVLAIAIVHYRKLR